MRVDIEKRHIAGYEKIAREVNRAVKKTTLKAKKSKYAQAVVQKDISVENKKKKLAKNLHELIISTFSVNINKKIATDSLKANIEMIRYIIHKIKSINNYLEEDLLRELGVIKKSLIVKAVKSGTPARYLEQSARVLTENDISRIEHTVYEMIHKIIFFDKKLLKDYKSGEIKVIKTEKLGIRNLEKILRAESELLEILEAKIPPPNKVKAKLFTKKIFSSWVPMVFALLSAFETECNKENSIFLNIKANDKLRKKIEKKIKHVIKEKEKLLKIKEKRALQMKTFGNINDGYRQTFHEYVSAASL